MGRRLLKRAQQTQASIAVELGGLFGPDAGAADDSPKWVQVTREGNFPGYLGGLRPFAFTRLDLQAMVDNVRSHPAFALDAQGVPVGDVIPWDFNHASEANPTSGDLPVAGAPSQAWTLDMEIRDGDDGTAELWALTRFMEPGRTYVRAGQYKWASVAVTFNAVHPESGQNVGAMVTSIAMTNTPFVEGMSSLAASKRGAEPDDVRARRMFYEAAADAGEAIRMMRELFALPETAGAAEVMQQLAIVAQWVQMGTAPLGTDPEHIVGNLRIILNLPTLTPQASVLEEAGSSIQRLLEEQAAAAGNPATGPEVDSMVPSTSATVAATRQKENEAMEEFIKVLASLLGVRQSEDAVKDAVREIVQLRAGLQETFGLSRDGVSVLLAEAKDATDAKTKLLGLFGALGVEDPEAAVSKVAEVMQSAAQLKEVMPELEGLRVEKKKLEDDQAETDVDEAIAACKLHPSVRGALLLQRQQDPKGFVESYPKPAPGSAGNQHLLNRVAASGATPLRAAPVAAQATPDVIEGQTVINLSAYPGRNPTSRAKAYLAGTVANWADLSNEDQHLRALHLKRQPHVLDQAAG